MLKKLKICFITEDFYPEFIGGQGVYGYHLVKNLARMGHKVTVLAEKRGPREKFWKKFKDIKLYQVPFCFGNQLILAFLEYYYFKKYLSQQYFDIVHANQLSGFFFVIFKPKNVGKIIVSEWNIHYEMYQTTKSVFKKIIYLPLILLERILYSLADGIIFDSPREQQNFANFLKLDQPQTSIYLGTDQVRFTNSQRNEARIVLRKKLNLPLKAKIVLYIGRLVERKRVDTIIKALKILEKNGIYGIIVGDGPERKKLEKMAGKNVKFLEFNPDLGKYYLASDLFVTVSQAEGGFLLTALEAANYGLPLILSPSAAGFPIIKEGINGYIVDPDRPKDLADKIKRVILRLVRLCSPQVRSGQVGEESRKFARQFSWERCARETIKFYQQLLERPHRIL